MPSVGFEHGFGASPAQKQGSKKSWQHPKDFPSGPPPQYYPGPATVNFGVLKRSGVFVAVWPPANTEFLAIKLPLYSYLESKRKVLVQHFTI
jgi:hypothetical protein